MSGSHLLWMQMFWSTAMTGLTSFEGRIIELNIWTFEQQPKADILDDSHEWEDILGFKGCTK